MTVMVERPSSVGEALSAVRSLLAGAVECPLWSVDDGDLTSLVVEAGGAVAQAQALLLGLVGAADARDVLLGDGAPSAQAWVRHRLRLSPSEASAYVKTGRALRSELGETAAACAAGKIGLAHAAVITRTMADLPADRALRRDAEQELVEDAEIFDPVVLSRLGRRLLAVVDPDAADARDGDALARAEERARRRMDLTFIPDGDGGSWLRGRLDPAGTAVVRAALDPLSAPAPRPPRDPTRGRPAGAARRR